MGEETVAAGGETVAVSRVAGAEPLPRGSEHHLRLALAAARMATWEWDLGSGRVEVSGTLDSVLGLGLGVGFGLGLGPGRESDGSAASPTPPPTAAFLSPSPLANVHPDDRQRLRDADRRTAVGHGGYQVEFRVVAPDGSIHWLAETARVVERDPTGAPRLLVGVVSDVSERKALEARLEHRATHDPLTALPNRELLIARLGEALGRGADAPVAPAQADYRPAVATTGTADAATDAGSVAILFIDLDGFKAVNDRLGHEAGDRYLAIIGERLAASVRRGDTAARLGGDEFVVLLADATKQDAAAVAERIVDRLRRPIVIAGELLPVSVSVGIALGRPGATRPDDLLRAADAALYQAKAAGRNTSREFRPRYAEIGLESAHPAMFEPAACRRSIGDD